MKDSDKRAVEDADVFQEAVERLRSASMDISSCWEEISATDEMLRGKTKSPTVYLAFSIVSGLVRPISFCNLPNAENGGYLASLLFDDPKRLLELFELNEESLTRDLLEVYKVVDDAFKEERKKDPRPLSFILKQKWVYGLSRRGFSYKHIIAKLRKYIKYRDEIFAKRDAVLGTSNAEDRRER